jgi:hypothetical protein
MPYQLECLRRVARQRQVVCSIAERMNALLWFQQSKRCQCALPVSGFGLNDGDASDGLNDKMSDFD